MFRSEWKCPQCKNKLFVTRSPRYWCDCCGREVDAKAVDPMGRDWVFQTIAHEARLERSWGMSFEAMR